MSHGNGVETDYTYDPKRRWLQTILTGNSEAETLQDTNYTFDKVGNVLGIANAAANVTRETMIRQLVEGLRRPRSSSRAGRVTFTHIVAVIP